MQPEGSKPRMKTRGLSHVVAVHRHPCPRVTRTPAISASEPLARTDGEASVAVLTTLRQLGRSCRGFVRRQARSDTKPSMPPTATQESFGSCRIA
eukprot:3465392-Prymnesium_polylepis.3